MFAGRRLAAEGVALVVAQRTDPGREAAVDLSWADQHTVQPLGAEAARALLAERAPDLVPPGGRTDPGRGWRKPRRGGVLAFADGIDLDATAFGQAADAALAAARRGEADAARLAEAALSSYRGPLLPDVVYESWAEPAGAPAAGRHDDRDGAPRELGVDATHRGPGAAVCSVVGTGVDPVTFRFSGGRSAN